MILRAFIIVPIPIVSAAVGTSSTDSKKRELASMVFCVSAVLCVNTFNLSSGSLKPICPFCPIPRIWISTPADAEILFS